MRQFLSRARVPQNEIAALIQTIFASELIAPSLRIWLVSPWLRDVEVFDNRSGGFSSLEPEWDGRMVRISELLAALVRRGAIVRLVSLANESEVPDALRQSLPSDLRTRVHHLGRGNLHVKGLLTSRSFLSGSMNFTNRGIKILDEMLTYHTEPDKLAQHALQFEQHYGGEP